MRVVVLCALMGVAFSANLRPSGDVAKDDGTMVPATIGNIDGVSNAPTQPAESTQPVYTEFANSKAEKMQAPVPQDAGKSFVPEYMPAKPEPVHSIVTKGFCTKVLKAVQEKQAPYYIHGEFTGEMRTDLLEQCGANICKWGMEYKKTVEKCDKCPASCDKTPAAFFDHLLNDSAAAAPIIKAILHVAGQAQTTEVHIQLNAAGDAPVAADDGYPLPAEEGGLKEGQDGDGPTKGFCVKVLSGIKNRAAPYYLEGQYTGECRQNLVDVCGERICGWAAIYKHLSAGTCDQGNKESFLSKMLLGGHDKALDELITTGKKANAAKTSDEKAADATVKTSEGAKDETEAAPDTAATTGL